MINTPGNSPDDALAWLGPLPSLVYQAVEYAVEEAHGFFETKKKPLSPMLFASLVRWHCIQFLSRPAFKHVGFDLHVLLNDGLEILFKGCRVHLWKADNNDGELPMPRGSETKTDFYTQPDLFPFSPEGIGKGWSAWWKLVITWEFRASQGLLAVNLICPFAADGDWKPGKHYWTVPIPHPVTAMGAAEEFGTSDQDLDTEQSGAGAEGQ